MSFIFNIINKLKLSHRVIADSCYDLFCSAVCDSLDYPYPLRK